jgi:putative protease
MMSYTRPNNRGVAVGRVAATGGGRTDGLVAVDLTQPVTHGDVLEFRTSRGHVVVTLDDFETTQRDRSFVSSKECSCAELPNNTKESSLCVVDNRIYLRIPEPVGKGDRVFRVRSAALLNATEPGFDNTVFQGNNGLVPVEARIVLRQGQQAEVGFGTHDSEGRYQQATVRGAMVEAARTKPLAADDVREHVGRIGGTPFTIVGWDIQLDEGVGMGFSTLHRLRTEALAALTEELLNPWRTRSITPREKPAAHAPARKGRPRIAAIVRDEAGARTATQAGAEVIYLHSLRFDATQRGGSFVSSKEFSHTEPPGDTKEPPLCVVSPCVSLLPAVAHDGELATLIGSLADGQAVLVNNLGELEALRNTGRPLETGPSLNACNGETLDTLASLGAIQVWLSPELSQRDIAHISPKAPVPLALTIVGQQEVMITEHCVLMAQGPCDQRCATCTRRKAPRLLEDRKGYRFPVRTDDSGRSHLFNAVPLDLVPLMPELVSLGLSTLVVDGTLLATKELKAEITRALRARDLALKGAGNLPKREGHTTGHFFRGVL